MRDRKSKMPEEIGATYDALDKELAWFQRTLTSIYDLYIDKPTQVDVFNQIAPDFFGFLQTTLFDALIVQLSRLTDAEANRSQENLSFKRLAVLVDADAYPDLNAEVHKYLAVIEKHSESARKHRNKRIAHSDLNVALSSSKLPDVFVMDFKEAFKAGRDLLNAVTRFFDGFEVSHTVAPAPGGVSSLVHAINRAHAAKTADSFEYHMGFKREGSKADQVLDIDSQKTS